VPKLSAILSSTFDRFAIFYTTLAVPTLPSELERRSSSGDREMRYDEGYGKETTPRPLCSIGR
jgi:hypothetical protein